MFADVEDLNHVGVLKPGDCLSLGAEALQLGRGGVGAGQNHLEGDGAVEAELAGPIDHAHAAPAELVHNFVARGGRPRLLESRRHRTGRPGAALRPRQPCCHGALAEGVLAVVALVDVLGQCLGFFPLQQADEEFRQGFARRTGSHRH
jgi:hypothetical protein